MEPRVQYTRTSDGVSIAHWSIGEGEAIVFMPSMPLSHIEFEWRFPEWRAFYERFAERRRVIRYDGRGTGLSDRKAINYSLETLGLDLEAVLDRLGIERLTLFSAYLAGPAAVSYAVAHPERVSNLVLWCSFPDGSEVTSPTIRATRSLIDQDWEVYAQTAAHVLLGWNAGEAAQTFSRFIAEANSVEGVEALFQAAARFNVKDLLASVTAPTLVMQRRGISWLGLDLGRELAAGIPNARLAVLEGESIAPFVGNVDAVVNTVFDFLGDTRPEPPTLGSSLRTILFTDIEGHTAIMRRLGDEKGRAMLRDFEAMTREALRANGGAEIKTLGDGFMASFTSTQKALQCSIALQRAFQAYSDRGGVQLKVRVGLNAGRPMPERGDLFGTAVILAERCAAGRHRRPDPGHGRGASTGSG